MSCPRFCGKCGSSVGTSNSSSSSSSCHDDTGCSSYASSVCSVYQEWAREHCPNRCGYCAGRIRRKLSSTLLQPPCDYVLTSLKGVLDVIGQLDRYTCSQMLVAPSGHVIHTWVEVEGLDCTNDKT
ncbi:hypothetical protein PoB_001469800 [Plakobranchus ocellatus]|uniref:ShKT domain-containing protein n=1 Tax=Plakobranchus ocellatus TaxID=259542 RepID=A0AAV3Z101_9GAST|nr:hypothetical protein PoB_001469800 [Plakobranchus ocellatus]